MDVQFIFILDDDHYHNMTLELVKISILYKITRHKCTGFNFWSKWRPQYKDI